MRAHVLSVGSELILGHLTDTNATFLAQELVALGIELLHVTQVGDDRARLAGTIRRACEDADLVVSTGGVGPTEDDLTREAIADVVGQTPTVDKELLATVEAFFAARGLTMPARNAKQAWLIPDAEALPNPVGTAPGWFVRHHGTRIVAMPGVPREMFRMWREQAVPRIIADLPQQRSVRSVTFRTIGIGESAAEQELADLVALPNPVVATYAKDDGVHVRVTAFGDTAVAAERVRDETAARVRERLGRYIYADTDEPLPAVMAGMLRRSGLRIGIVESGTGGRFANLIAGHPGCGDVLAGAVVLGGRDTDRDPASSMADLARARWNAPLGLGLRADVERGELGIYSGTVSVAVTGARVLDETTGTRGAYDDMQRRAAMTAADVLCRALMAPETTSA